MNPPLSLIVPKNHSPPTAVGNDFFSTYLNYVGDTEVPANFHRWSIISALGAFLGRGFYMQHGSFNVHTNMYCMLIGSPGTRKSTAIKLVKKLITDAGYTTIAADRSSKEKFMLDLSGEQDLGEISTEQRASNFLDQNLWNDDESTLPDAEMFIMADELNDFIGLNNIEFISLLGSLWDYRGIYKNRIKTGRSISVNNPTISILAGNTPTGFAQAFPAETIGQGFFSRLLLIYGESSGRKITFPQAPDIETTRNIVTTLREIKSKVTGCANISLAAQKLFIRIYTSDQRIDDVRFEHYYNRRLTHLLKLSLIFAAARISTTIDDRDVIYANTVLTHAEHSMPRALGEFGKSKNAGVSHKIIQVLEASTDPLSYKELWKHVSSDLDKMTDLSTLIQNLVAAEKIIAVPGGLGFLSRRKVLTKHEDDLVDFSLLTSEERKSIQL